MSMSYVGAGAHQAWAEWTVRSWLSDAEESGVDTGMDVDAG